jgi:diacylglycerol O-acyltransferase / trehalose O-mycolyltransferase
MRSAIGSGAVALAVLALAPSAAAGATIVTWEGPDVSESRFVDPAAAPAGSYNEPPGVAERPNALRVNVYLPDGYHPDGHRRYPVLYLLHGQGDAYDSWANPLNGDLLNVAEGFPGLIVMPEGDRGFYANWWNGGRRGEPAWERYHLDELIPAVEQRLRVRHGRRWHAIAGLSMGGEGAMFYASQRPGYFGSAASFSGPLSIQRSTYQSGFEAATGQDREALFGDPEVQEFYWEGHNPKALVENLLRTRLYVAAGDGVPDPSNPDEAGNQFGQVAEAELGQQAAEFADAAVEEGADITYAPHQGIHDWPYWRRDLANAIDWGLFAPAPAGNAHHWTFRTAAQRSEAWGIRLRFQQAPTEVVTFYREGRSLIADGTGVVTIRTRAGCVLRNVPLPFSLDLARGHPCTWRSGVAGQLAPVSG